MDARILSASGAEGHRPPVTSHESRVTSCKLFRFTLLSKNAPANHLVSHSCKNKGLKVPCFHTLTKNIGGQGSPHPANVVIPSEPAILARDERGSRVQTCRDEGSQCSEGCKPQSANPESLVTNHESLRLSRLTSTLTNFASATPLTSTLTKTKDLKSFIINTYKKGVGPPVTSHESQVQRDNFRPALWYPNQRQWNPT